MLTQLMSQPLRLAGLNEAAKRMEYTARDLASLFLQLQQETDDEEKEILREQIYQSFARRITEIANCLRQDIFDSGSKQLAGYLPAEAYKQLSEEEKKNLTCGLIFYNSPDETTKGFAPIAFAKATEHAMLNRFYAPLKEQPQVSELKQVKKNKELNMKAAYWDNGVIKYLKGTDNQPPKLSDLLSVVG